MKTISEAQVDLFAAATPQDKIKQCFLSEAKNKILATDIVATHAVPPADNSAMDGYALRCKDWQGILAVSQRIAAGYPPQALAEGTAARIFTGGEIPAGADVVVMQENTHLEAGGLKIIKPPQPGENIRRAGQDIALTSVVVSKGTRLNAINLGLIASQGLSSIPVMAAIKVALVNSGDELIEPGGVLQPGQLYNTNGIALETLLKTLGCEVASFNLNDNLMASQQLLARLAREFHVIITTGGVSAGEEDHIKAAVEAIGVIELWQVAMKPGKPLMFGFIETTPILGLPGNPVSALMTFLFFAKPFIERIQGSKGQLPAAYRLPLNAAQQTGTRDEFIRVQRSRDGLTPFLNQSSGVLRSLAWADGVALLPANTNISPGDCVDYWPLTELMLPR